MDWKVIKKHDIVMNRRVEKKKECQNNKMGEIKVYMTNNSRKSWYTYKKRKQPFLTINLFKLKHTPKDNS